MDVKRRCSDKIFGLVVMRDLAMACAASKRPAFYNTNNAITNDYYKQE